MILLSGRRFTICFILILTLISASVYADSYTDRRIIIGAKIFRALLAADNEIQSKKAEDSTLRLIIIYEDRPENAETAKETLSDRSSTTIRDTDISVVSMTYSEYTSASSVKSAGVFLVEQLSGEKLTRLINITGKQKIILFSPFKGDVERGVTGGISVEAKVRPYLNITSVKKAGISLKPFFIKVAKIYE